MGNTNEINKVAICGKIRSGKDTVAEIFINNGFKRFFFADGIGKTVNLLYPELVAKGKPRKHLQGVGQAVRTFDPDVWVNYAFKQIEASGADKVIITDLRQPNELKALREAGFFIIRVYASKEVRLERARRLNDNFDPADFEHETEAFIDGFVVDLEIINEGTLDELVAQAYAAVGKVRRGVLLGKRLRP